MSDNKESVSRFWACFLFLKNIFYGGKLEEEPVSRFWACFFSGSIFALFWTLKMNVTIKWLIVVIGTYCVGIVFNIIFPYPYGFIVNLLVGHGLPIYFMYSWTSEYNFKTFGYESKIEWKNSKN